MRLVGPAPVGACHLGPESHLPAEAKDTVPSPAAPGTLEEVERRLMHQSLESNGWNVSEAARRLGVSREVLRYRMRKYGIVPPGR